MINRTTELAIRALLVVYLEGGDAPRTPRRLAEQLGCSVTYLQKTLNLLVKGGILRSVKGAHGGILPAWKAEEVTLREVVEACQGLLVGDHCEQPSGPDACSFHRAALQIHESLVEVLESWTLADLVKAPVSPTSCDERRRKGLPACRMVFAGCEAFVPLRQRKAGPRRVTG